MFPQFQVNINLPLHYTASLVNIFTCFAFSNSVVNGQSHVHPFNLLRNTVSPISYVQVPAEGRLTCQCRPLSRRRENYLTDQTASRQKAESPVMLSVHFILCRRDNHLPLHVSPCRRDSHLYSPDHFLQKGESPVQSTSFPGEGRVTCTVRVIPCRRESHIALCISPCRRESHLYSPHHSLQKGESPVQFVSLLAEGRVTSHSVLVLAEGRVTCTVHIIPCRRESHLYSLCHYLQKGESPVQSVSFLAEGRVKGESPVQSVSFFAEGRVTCTVHVIPCRRESHLYSPHHSLQKGESPVQSTSFLAEGRVTCTVHIIPCRRESHLYSPYHFLQKGESPV